MLICLGIFSLAAAAFQRRQALKEMKALYDKTPPRSLAGFTGGLVAAMGIAALAILLFEM